jgi:hypothetical protein
MRLAEEFRFFGSAAIALAVLFPVVAWGGELETMAEGLVQTLSGIGVPATALGLTLITAGNRPKH